MGTTKHKVKVLGLFKRSPVVDLWSVARIVKGNYYKQLIRSLIREKEIFPLGNGWYSRYDDPSLIVYCLTPAYLGLQDALSHHGLWEQETLPLIITSRKVRQGIRAVGSSNVLIRRLDRRYMFGYEYADFKEYCLKYSDVEKTVIDLIYYNETFDHGVLEAVNMDKVMKYLKKYPERFRNRVQKILNIRQCQKT